MKERPEIVLALMGEEATGKLQSSFQKLKPSVELPKSKNDYDNETTIFKGDNEQKSIPEIPPDSKETLHILMNLINDPVVIVNKKGIFLEASERVEELTGLKREDILGSNFMKVKFITAKSKALLIKNLTYRMLGKHIVTYDIEMISKDGEKLLLEVNGTKIDYEGKPADLVVLHDVSKQRKTDEALKKSEEEFRLIFENAKDAIFWMDSESGSILKCNNAAETLLEKKKEEIVGQNQTTIHPLEKKDHYDILFKEYMNEKGSVNTEVEVMTKSGKIIPTRITASVTIVDGKLIIQEIFHDTSERRLAEEKLKEKISELEKFQEVTVDRELQMIELKKEVNKICKKYGEKPRYVLEEKKGDERR